MITDQSTITRFWDKTYRPILHTCDGNPQACQNLCGNQFFVTFINSALKYGRPEIKQDVANSISTVQRVCKLSKCQSPICQSVVGLEGNKICLCSKK